MLMVVNEADEAAADGERGAGGEWARPGASDQLLWRNKIKATHLESCLQEDGQVREVKRLLACAAKKKKRRGAKSLKV